MGNVSYLVLIFSSLSYFFPIFGQGNNVYSYLGSSFLLWMINYLVLRGIKDAVVLNLFITITKYTPLIIFCAVMIWYFDTSLFLSNIAIEPNTSSNSILSGISDMVMVSIWAFMGMEGAVTISNRAKSPKCIRRATMIGVLCVLFTYVSITLLTLGFMEQSQIAALPDPSMAYLMESVLGPIGAHLVIAGVIISILGAFLGWIILCNEVLYVGSQHEHIYPRFIAIRNLHGSPQGAILFSGTLVQIILSVIFLFGLSYREVFFLTSAVSIIPYLLSSIYNIKVINKRIGYAPDESSVKDWISGMIAVVYCLFCFYAAGLYNILFALVLYIPGVFFYAIAKHQYSESNSD